MNYRHLAGFALLMTCASQVFALKSDQDRVAELGAVVEERLAPLFEDAGVAYPPKSATLIAFKEEKVLQVYAPDAGGVQRFITSYPIVSVSGTPGPKLRMGDLQVPEGLYEVSNLNPNSAFHLALRVNYPNPADRARAAAEKRTNLGGEIMIQGFSESTGSICVDDQTVEDLFVLAAKTNYQKVKVIISPVDFRDTEMDEIPDGAPAWTSTVYDSLRSALAAFPSP